MTLVAWQGWQLQIPSRWSPVKLEGDYETGHALFADLHRARMGIRWKRPRKRTDPHDWAQRAMREEVGHLASREARPHQPEGDDEPWQSPLLYMEPDPPGRDVWLAVSSVSGRAIELIHHARRRERILAETIVPTLCDMPQDQPAAWSIFELSCNLPPGFKLASQRLMAGDLGLTFSNGRQEVAIRQVAVAQLALQRQPLEKWLDKQLFIRRKHYRPVGAAQSVELTVADHALKGLMRTARRRRRFFYKRWLFPQLTAFILHDEPRDRLVFVESSDESLARQVAPTVGFAARE